MAPICQRSYILVYWLYDPAFSIAQMTVTARAIGAPTRGANAALRGFPHGRAA
jgi:hypothetical protein